MKDKDVDPEKGGEGFYVGIFHHYVDYTEFSGLAFDNTIRLFLSGLFKYQFFAFCSRIFFSYDRSIESWRNLPNAIREK